MKRRRFDFLFWEITIEKANHLKRILSLESIEIYIYKYCLICKMAHKPTIDKEEYYVTLIKLKSSRGREKATGRLQNIMIKKYPSELNICWCNILIISCCIYYHLKDEFFYMWNRWRTTAYLIAYIFLGNRYSICICTNLPDSRVSGPRSRLISTCADCTRLWNLISKMWILQVELIKFNSQVLDVH